MLQIDMNAQDMRLAFEALDAKLQDPLRLVMAGGAAMLLQYGHSQSTSDVDAAPQPYRDLRELEPLFLEVARELGLPSDWLNTHFTDFTYVIPEDFEERLRPYFKGRRLVIDCFGPEDIAIMKLMAARPKDRPHLRRLFRLPGFDFGLVENHLHKLFEAGLSKAEAGLELMDELRDEIQS